MCTWCCAHVYTLCARGVVRMCTHYVHVVLCTLIFRCTHERSYVDMTCRVSALACRQENESLYLPSEKAKSNTAATNYKVVSELERHTVASSCTETLTLMDVNVACITKTLNILVANISGFTVLHNVSTHNTNHIMHNGLER